MAVARVARGRGTGAHVAWTPAAREVLPEYRHGWCWGSAMLTYFQP